MFSFYKFEVFPNLWICVIKTGKKVVRIINDKSALIRALSSQKFLVGYGNYEYDDIILWSILYDKNPYFYSQKLRAGEIDDYRFLKIPYITIDAMQELANAPGLQEIEGFRGVKINTLSVDRNTPLMDENIKEVSEHCYRDVCSTEEIFFFRKDYFETKFDVVKTFNLPVHTLRKTQTGLVAEVLQAQPFTCTDRLDIQYDARLNLAELPAELVGFYDSIKQHWTRGADAEQLETTKFQVNIAGIEHQYGFGGIHGAQKDYIKNGSFLHIDAKSFYPSLMINNNFISRASASPELFKQLYSKRMNLLKEHNPKEQLYKLLLNKTFGASKSKYNKLFDARQANNVAINGQLILTHLILILEPFAELVQSNTDGIIIKYDHEMKQPILDVIKRFSEQYEINFEIKEIERIAQRDVNNYAIRYRNGNIKAVGIMARHTGGDWSRNHLNIIDIALVRYYMDGIEPARSVIDEYKKGNIAAFQMIVKTGAYDFMAQETKEGQLVTVPDVCRIFAAKNDSFGYVYKARAGRYTRVSDCPERTIIYNDDLGTFDKTMLDLRYYIDLIERKLF